VGAFFSGIRDWLYGISSEKVGMSVRGRFFESIVRKDIGFYDDRKVGDLRKYNLIPTA
jgi:ABC-type bacteriocin/lantibiotic exporter with double-glycine peptidase domain